MAKTTHTVITDDIDGSANAATFTFSINGTDYTIDLAEKNAAKLDKALAPFVAKATRVGSRRRSTAASKAKRSDLADVRTWAKSNGYDVSERGRVPASVLSAYDAAQ